MKHLKRFLPFLTVCLLLSFTGTSQVSDVVNKKQNQYEFTYHFKAKKTQKIEDFLYKKLGEPVKDKVGRKVVWKSKTTKAKLKRGKLKVKHRGDDIMRWKLMKTRMKLML